MAKKLKKKVKRRLIIFIVLISLSLIGIGILSLNSMKPAVGEVKVVSKIPGYGYNLKDNKSKLYKKYFNELKKVLTKKKVNEKEYAKVLTKLFVTDFYSLGDHVAKTDIGGVDFVHEDGVKDFTTNAEDTYYKYVESNIYKNRNQELPIISNVKIESVEQTAYTYNDETDEEAYEVKASWEYKSKGVADGYQDEGTFIFIHDGKKLVLVEALNGDEKWDEEDSK